jgi:hypothetical protein
MPRFARIAYGLAGLLLIHLLNHTLAWLLLGGVLAYVIGERRRRSLGGISLS